MSAISHKKSKKDFDVLEDQDVQSKNDKNLHHIKLHRIHAQSDKATISEENSYSTKKPEPQVSPFAQVTDFVKESTIPNDGFKSAMKGVLHYVRGLKDRKKAKILEFDLSVFESSDDYENIVQILSEAVKGGVLTKVEESQVLNLLKGFENKSSAESVSDQIVETDEVEGFIGIEKIKNYSRDSLPEVREEYISEYVKWEEKSRHGKKMFSKTIGELGGSRPLPSRLTKKHNELELIEREYQVLLKKISNEMNFEEKMEFLMNERITLSKEINSRRKEKERKIINQGLNGWDGMGIPGKTVMTSSLLSGDIDNISHASVVPQVGYEGYRAPRLVVHEEETLSNKPADISDKLAKFIERQNEKRQNLNQIVPETNIEVSEIKENKSGFLSGFKKAFGIEKTKPRSEHSVQNNEIPVPETMPLEQKNIISSYEHPLSHRIPFHNGFIDIVDTGVAKKVLLNNMEIASIAPLGEGNILCLYEKYQDGSEFSDIREAFNIAFDNTFALENRAEVIEEISFENGKIAILFGLPGNREAINILLNGKVIAIGKMGNRGPEVNLIEGEGVKSGWLMADTVYERAFKKSAPVLKTLKKS